MSSQDFSSRGERFFCARNIMIYFCFRQSEKKFVSFFSLCFSTFQLPPKNLDFSLATPKFKAFVAAVRATFLIARDNGDKNRRLFLPIINNIGNDETGLAFAIQSVTLSGGIETSRVCWEAEAVAITADEAMALIGDPEERSVLDDAKKFLANLLADGPVSSKQIRADAIGGGISWRTIQRAQNALDIDAY